MQAADYQQGIMSRGWNDTASADNDTATATKAGVTGSSHFVTHVSASFGGAATKLLQIKDGDTVIWEKYVVNSDDIAFLIPLPITADNAVSAVLAASGTGGTLGKVNLVGFTV